MGEHRCLNCEKKCLNQFIPESELIQAVNIVDYQAGENIINQGHPVQNYHILCQGHAKVGSRNPKGKKALFSILQGAELVEKSCLHSSRDLYPINASAVTDATVGIISVEVFERLVEEYPPLSVYIQEIISRELDFQLQKTAASGWGGSKESLVWLLTELYRKLDHDGEDNEPMDLHLSGTDLAHMLGVSRGTVVRSLSSLKQKGLARATRGSVIVMDFQGLQEMKSKL